MFGHEQLTHCEQRKNALLKQSLAHRLVLRREAENIRPIAEWVDMGVNMAHKVQAGLGVLAPLISLWGGRKQGATGLVHKLAEAIALARSLMTVLGSWRR